MDTTRLVDKNNQPDSVGGFVAFNSIQDRASSLGAVASGSEPVPRESRAQGLLGHALDVSAPSRWLVGDRRRSRLVVATDDPLGGSIKRAFDLVVTAALCPLVLPVLGLLIVALALSSRGSVFYAQTRIGFRGRPFACLKLRTMVENGDAVLAAYIARHPEAKREWTETRKLKRDPRVTRVGRFLRLTSLDELPQFLNVLRGDMSLVGPRPIVSDELARYSIFQNSYLRTRPGVTGLWQVSGRSNASYERRVEFDRSYAAGWSIWTDLRILALTVPAVMRVHETA